MDCDLTTLEDDFRLMRRGPNVTFAKECATTPKRFIAPTEATLRWPEDRLRKQTLDLLASAGFHEHALILLMSDRMCAWLTSRVTKLLEAGIPTPEDPDAPAPPGPPLQEVDPPAMLLPIVEHGLAASVLDLKKDIVGWWREAWASVGGKDPDPLGLCTGRLCPQKGSTPSVGT